MAFASPFFLRRLCAALALLLSMSCALAEQPTDSTLSMDARMGALAAASQHDDFYRAFTYKSLVMYDSGCGPVSMANAMGAAFGLSDVTVVQELSIELVNLLTPPRHHKDKHISIDILPRELNELIDEPNAERYPVIMGLLDSYAGRFDISRADLSDEDTALFLSDADGGIYMRYVHATTIWPNLVSLCRALTDAGKGDAMICAGYLGVGRKTSGSPLYSMGSGHYVAIVVQAESFIRDGSVYLLDSLPRALEDESIEAPSPYNIYLPYIKDRRFTEFKTSYTGTRIMPTIIRFTPSAEPLAALHALSGDPAAQDEAHLELLHLFKLFGQGCAFIVIPPDA